jgi:cytochrome P450
MAMFPEVQKKAQAELDAVIGRERLPDFNDYDSLPYINAVVKETLRWQPVLPVGELLFLGDETHVIVQPALHKGFPITL